MSTYQRICNETFVNTSLKTQLSLTIRALERSFFISTQASRTLSPASSLSLRRSKQTRRLRAHGRVQQVPALGGAGAQGQQAGPSVRQLGRRVSRSGCRGQMGTVVPTGGCGGGGTHYRVHVITAPRGAWGRGT